MRVKEARVAIKSKGKKKKKNLPLICLYLKARTKIIFLRVGYICKNSPPAPFFEYFTLGYACTRVYLYLSLYTYITSIQAFKPDLENLSLMQGIMRKVVSISKDARSYARYVVFIVDGKKIFFFSRVLHYLNFIV